MECRFCLCSTPAESSVSIHSISHPLVQRILTCCQLDIEKYDCLPNVICLLCMNSLESLSSFRNTCIQNDKSRRPKSVECSSTKRKEIISNDLVFKNDISLNSLPNVYTSPASNVDSERELTVLKACDPNQKFHLTRNKNGAKYSKKCKKGVKSTEKKTFECEICLKSFPYKSFYLNHMKCHTKESHKCGICSKSLRSKLSFEEHMNCHLGIKAYQCKICSKSYSYRSYFLVHVKSHTEKKLYDCEFCSKTFSRRSTLATHVKSHTGEGLFKCDICLKSFIDKYRFTNHLKVHDGANAIYKCDVCMKILSSKYSLDCHMNIHNGIKPHKCEICSKSFTFKSNLQDHKQYHTGGKPFKCDLCMKAFTRKYSLRNHIKSHSEIKLKKNSSFENISIPSEEPQKVSWPEYSDIKREEIILDDLVWENEIGSLSNDDEHELAGLK
ncbi:uncharacterized protein LOC143909651 [Arctopsyche grandis]|uniref:uncharacterized protein LOC143909651 n=1 Tax=Arctopsyche grandis TaxID=121162 RepID=UPI00406D91D5